MYKQLGNVSSLERVSITSLNTMVLHNTRGHLAVKLSQLSTVENMEYEYVSNMSSYMYMYVRILEFEN